MSELWTLVYEGIDPDQEALREALCTLGNGYFATRGAAEESSADTVPYPGTYIAGGYDRLVSRVGDRDVVNEDLVNFPNWLPVSFRVDETPWFGLRDDEIGDYRQTLDLRRGMLTRSFTVRGMSQGGIHIKTERFVSMRDSHVAAIRWTIEADHPVDRLQIRSLLDGNIENWGVARYRDLRGDHTQVIDIGAPQDDVIRIHSRTKQAPLDVSICARHRLFLDGELCRDPGAAYEGKNAMEWLSPRFSLEPGRTLCIEKVVSLHTSRDPALGDLVQDGLEELAQAPGFDALLARHCRSWSQLWDQFDLQIDVDLSLELEPHPIQLILRLHTFHLLQTSSPNSRSLDISVPARGWTGESYRGHIFWDEAYILPFYIARAPEIARSLLLYRYRRLDEARKAAKESGLSGAMYPWQSGSSGREETQVIHLNPKSGRWDPDHSHLQRHVNAAIALDVWRYVQTTGDLVFLEEYGAEMLIEIARLWASLCTWSASREAFEIHGVMGPDEFHEAYPEAAEGGVRNNAYTNVLAVWCMKRARDALARLPLPAAERLKQRLHVSDDELAHWEKIGAAIYLPVMSNGLLEQFEGYESLDELDWERYRNAHEHIGRMDRILKAEGDSPDGYKLSKQADLCMLFYFLEKDELSDLLAASGYDLSPERIKETILYYRDRTSHGSTLSHLVFGAILDPYEPTSAWEHYIVALRSDVDDIQGGTTPEGIHTAVMAGTVRHVIERMAGVSVRDGEVYVDPALPNGIRYLSFRYRAFGASVCLRIDSNTVELDRLEGGTVAIPMTIFGRRFDVEPGCTLVVDRAGECGHFTRRGG